MQVTHVLTVFVLAGVCSAVPADDWATAMARDPAQWPPWEQQVQSLRAAIVDLTAEFGPRYPEGREFLRRLDGLRPRLAAEEPAALGSLEALRRQVLTANPLVRGTPILFVVRQQYAKDHHNTGTDFEPGEISHRNYRPGGALKVLDLRRGDKPRTLLATERGVIRDPDVHYDGRRIVFAMRSDGEEAFQIYTIGADGTGLARLTHSSPHTDIDPAWLPDERIVFASTRDQKYCGCNRHVQANLFVMQADGRQVLQISRNNLFDSRPTVLPDGRILYDRWEYVDSMYGPRFGLWTVNPDGTQHALYCGNNDWAPGAIFDAHPIPGTERVVAVFGACHDRPWGAMVVLDRRRGLDGMAPVVRSWPADLRPYMDNPPGYRLGDNATAMIDTFRHLPLKYEDPCPLADPATGRSGKYFLCVRTLEFQHPERVDCVRGYNCRGMVDGREQTGIFLVDVFGNELLLHAEKPGCFDPLPLVPRPRPPVIPSRVDYACNTGTCYVADVYRGSGMEQVPRGTVRWLRVVEAPPKRNWTPRIWDRDTNQAPGMNFNCTSSKRVLGDAPVAADGSAYFEVPADRFVFFQLLDKNKMMIQSMRTGTTLMPGEHVGCVGCHEGRLEGTQSRATATLPAALRHGPSRLEPWFGAPREFNYLTEVQPVFERHCVECHDYGREAGRVLNLAGDLGLVFNTSYLDLHIKSAMRWEPDPPGAPKRIIKVIHDGPPEVLPPYAWGSHRSRLVDVLRGDHYGRRLSAEELARLITWIDLNAPYYGSYHSVYGENLYGRAPLRFEQLADLADLTGLPYSAYRDPARRGWLDGRLHHGPVEGTELAGSQVNFSRPELSPCLAKLDPREPRYQKALAIIREGQAALRRQPREDQLGPAAVPVRTIERERAERCRQQLADEWAARDAILTGSH
jgi:hypothetical protein